MSRATALPRVRPMTPGIPHAARLRAYLCGVVVSAGLFGVAWKAWGLQIGQGDHYRALAEKQHEQNVNISAPRGDILDGRGRPLAVSAAADSIWANPHEIRDVTDTADKLARLIHADPITLEAKLAGDRRFVWLDRHVAPEIAKAVRDAKIPGIAVDKEPRRWYPARAIGGTVIGRSDIDGNGVDGIELAMNGSLVGHRGTGVALHDVRGKKMFTDGIERPESGATVHLSLDASIQASAEAAVTDAVKNTGAKSGVAVVIEVATGRVLAMASTPSYDPNVGDAKGPRNRAVADAFEAGSVMKVFSIAAALDEGIIAPTTEFDLGGGVLKIGPATITDVDHDPYLDVAGIIRRSSNVGAAKIALRFGAGRLHDALKKFGFGAKTGIELPGEQRGMLRDGARWRDIELATISYGYGLTVTPVQIAAALAAFGNGGVYHEPRVVDRVIDPDGTLLYTAAPAERRIVSEKTASQMLSMLAGVFDGGKTAGTAATLVVPGFRCGGKTGTAYKYDPALKAYSHERYLSSFAGLGPIDHPRLAIVVMIDDPTGGDHFGAKVAGPAFVKIASEALRYLGVPGTSEICPPPVPGAPPSFAAKTCLPAPPVKKPAAPPPPVVSASAKAAPPPVVTASDVEQIADDADDGTVAVPDFRGMGMARAIDAARQGHVAIEIAGTGRVIAQDPAPGVRVKSTGSPRGAGEPAARVTLRFSDGNSPVPRAASGPP
ncbi:MAG TPA: penicillin-binding transpeptidase domain-containing protein [Kofleriaceae bacterium]|nr:penicillin-binding transpeptidase domain-containing protein [Kofleriaceae bacterium]